MAERTIQRTHGQTAAGGELGRSMNSGKGGGHKAALVGLGILGYAADGVKAVFSALSRKGEEYEPASRDTVRRAGAAMSSTAGDLKEKVGHVGENVRHMGERREQHFAERVEAVLPRIDVPTREEWNSLNARVDDLNAKVEQLQAETATRREEGHPGG